MPKGRLPGTGRSDDMIYETSLHYFWRDADFSDDDDICWPWRGLISTEGYGSLRLGTPVRAHRFSYEIHNGRIPEGLVIDHICRNRMCVNPKHLRAVTWGINATENSTSSSALNKKKTHCPRGHVFTGHTQKNGKWRKRVCLICDRVRWARRYYKKGLK